MSAMNRRTAILAASTAVFSAGLGALGSLGACGEITPTTYGNPNTLDRKNLPGEGGVEQLVCSVGDAGDGGGFDGGCPSFATDIYPYFTAAGTWRCADKACHGGPTAPPVDGTSAAACLTSLKKINVKNVPYVSSDGGKDSNAQSLLCNVQGSCGSPMPKAPGLPATTADLCKLEAWLKCGAPP
jgi:hypothetical protein